MVGSASTQDAGAGRANAPLAGELARSWFELGRRMWSRRQTALLRPALPSLSPGQVQALMLLGELEQPRMGDLAAALGLDESTVTRLVDRLEQFGLAGRSHSSTDRRAHVVSLTTEGREVLATIQEQRQRLFGEILEALEPAEQAELVRLTEKVVDAWRAREASG
jgi:DNA-binding MarR family transcriptional regulator